MSKLEGTKEWADHNINLFTGNCKNGCIYCYAAANNHRFKKSFEFKVKASMLGMNFKKRDGITMYPSAHDIRPEHLNLHVEFLKRFLQPGNKVLIVTKPFPECIERLCKELIPYREQVEFRFTIGSSTTAILHYYEPFAPSFMQRAQAVEIAYKAGFQTSLSIEPMLDSSPELILNLLSCMITGEIWVVKMNHAVARIAANGHRDNIEVVKSLVEWQSDDKNIMGIVNNLSRYDNVRWKDSIAEVINRNKKENPVDSEKVVG